MAYLASIRKNWRLTAILVVAVLIVVGILGYRIKQNSAVTNPAASVPTVSLIAIKDYLEPAAITLDNGTVESVSQADLRAQVSAPISQVNANLGDNVGAGQIIAAQKNEDIQAQLASAQANLQTAQTGDRPEDLAISQTQVDQAKAALASAIQDAYAKSDDAIKNHIDKFFANPETSNLQFSIVIDAGAGGVVQFGSDQTDAQRQAETDKIALIAKMSAWQKSVSDPAISLETNLALAKNNLNYIINFLNDMSQAVNPLTSDNATYKQILDGYKTELSASRATISVTLSALQGTETSWRVASQTLALKQAGSTPEQLKQAQSAVDALQAQLDKTYIRAPFFGKVSFLDAKIGELASPGQLVATIVNPGALQITTYASANDLPNIAIGDTVAINTTSAGIVSRVSPAVDPQTKKAQLIVSVSSNDPKSPIIIGQTVALNIQSKKLAQTTPVYLLPLQAVRSNSEDFVYTVDQNNAVQPIPVTTRNLVGESIEVSGNLASDLKIISSTSGLSAGDKVIVQK